MIDEQLTTTAPAEEPTAVEASGVAPSPEPPAVQPEVEAQAATVAPEPEPTVTPEEVPAPADARPEVEAPAPAVVPEPDVMASMSEPAATAGQATPEPADAAQAAPEPRASIPESVEATSPASPGSEVAAEAAAGAPQPEAAAESPESAPAPPVASQSDEDLFEQAIASLETDDAKRESSKGINRGDRMNAEVIQVEKDRVFVNLGTKQEGVIPLSELTDANVDTAVGLVQPGDRFEVVVIKTAGAEGNPIVSKRKADFDQTWFKVLDAFDEGKIFEAQVVDRVKGGLVVDIGVRGFVPATHVGSGRLRNIEKFLGQTLRVKIIEVDRERRKVVLSNKAAEDESRDSVKQNIFGNAKVGDVMPGTVRRLTDYGAFVDLGGIDGLLHISEMSWYRIDHPKEVLKEGDDINVMVLRLDEASGRVSLGLRQVLPDPWNLIKENYKQGQKIQVKVSRIVQSGAFVRLPEGAEAFLPLSECSDKRIKKPNEVLEEGQDIEPMVIDLRPDDRRMVLSLREGAQPGADYNYGARSGGGGRDGDRNRQGGRRPMMREQSTEAPQATMRAPTGGATIGERLAGLKGLLKPGTDDAPEE